jgi:hypothetical protein
MRAPVVCRRRCRRHRRVSVFKVKICGDNGGGGNHGGDDPRLLHRPSLSHWGRGAGTQTPCSSAASIEKRCQNSHTGAQLLRNDLCSGLLYRAAAATAHCTIIFTSFQPLASFPIGQAATDEAVNTVCHTPYKECTVERNTLYFSQSLVQDKASFP